MKKAFTLTLLVLLVVLTACKTAPTDQDLDSRGESQIYIPQEGDITLIIELTTTSQWTDLKLVNQDQIKYTEVTSILGNPTYYDLEGGSIYLDQSPENAEKAEEAGLIVSYVHDLHAMGDSLEFELKKDCQNTSRVSVYGVYENVVGLIYQKEFKDSDGCQALPFEFNLRSSFAKMEVVGDPSPGLDEMNFVEMEPPTVQNGFEVELVTQSSWVSLEILDTEILSYDIIALLGEPTNFGQGNTFLNLDQEIPDSENGNWIGTKMRYEVDPETEDQTIEFLLTHDCRNGTKFKFSKVVDGELFPILNLNGVDHSKIFQCSNNFTFQVDLEQPLVLMRQYVIEEINLEQGDLEAKDQIMLEADLVSNSNWAELIFSNEGNIISSDWISASGELTNIVAKMDNMAIYQESKHAGSGKNIGLTARLGVDPNSENRSIPVILQNGCLNGATTRFFVNHQGKLIPIPLVGDQYSISTEGCNAELFELSLDKIQALIQASELFDELPMVAHLSDIKGEVLVRQAGMEEFFPAWDGNPVNVGGEVLTGANSEVYLSVSDGAVIRLGPNTIFSLEMGINSEEIILPRFGLQLGEMEVVSGSGGFLIYTPKSVVGAIGSAALVKVSAEGIVEMDCLAGDCFLYDGTAETAGVIEKLPETIKAALDVAVAQIDPSGDSEVVQDGDDDGVPDELDLCPQDGDHGYGIDAQGCPLPFINSDSSGSDGPQDWDGDGFFDFEDRCPTIYAPIDHNGSVFGNYGCPEEDLDFNGIPDDNECVAGEECLDRDGDGVPDNTDACPGIPWTPSDSLYQCSPADTCGCLRGDDDKNGIPDDLECVDCTPPDGYPSSLDDSDGDGVPDGIDSCLDQGDAGNGVYGNFSNMRGCPIPPTVSDLDGDGVPDENDICVDLGDAGYGVDLTGCPIPPMESDLDGDGVYDEDDTCVNLGDAGYGVDADGCPISIPDSDLDGYSDDFDLCPTEGNLGNGVDQNGCPYVLCEVGSQDWDGDGVPDCRDRCPTIYAPFDHNGNYLLDYGCPDGDLDFDGIPDRNECIPGEECNDRDGDGVPDYLDECPDIPWTPTDSMTGHTPNMHGCINGDFDSDGVPDDLECVGCTPPGEEPEIDDCFDRDQDGICAEEDQCDFVAGIPENDGCPASQDWDGDGYNDAEDRCPLVFAPWPASPGAVDPMGCPEGDNDYDGIPDNLECEDGKCWDDWDSDGVPNLGDHCPFIYSPCPNDDCSGCPPRDKDFNGVPDDLECADCVLPDIGSCFDQDQDGICPDMCPLVPGLPGLLGCPESGIKDYDGDGWPDAGDFCPTIHASGQNHGCPPGDLDFNGVPDEDTGICVGGDPGEECLDSDGDFIPDDLDGCPDEWTEDYQLPMPTANKEQNYSMYGCPPYLVFYGGYSEIPNTQDWDGDGIQDIFDLCPTVYAPGGYAADNQYLLAGCPPGDQDNDGVPDDLECTGSTCTDRDGDGFPDGEDLCPDNYSSWAGNSGCPEGDQDHDGVPDNLACEGCTPPVEPEPVSEVCTDSDQDGLCDQEDDCPYVAGSLENQGCQEGDSDGDGVRDGVDLCPSAVDPLYGVTPLGCPKVVTEREAESPADTQEDSSASTDTTEGSPQPTAEITVHKPQDQPHLVADQDNDGFADDYDKCPKEGDQGHGLGRDGCPLPAPKDSDGDGIFDDQDQCPNQGDQGAGLQRNGCPMADNDPDGDGVVGVFDKCPNQGGDVDRSGCPKKDDDPDGDGVAGSSDDCPNQGNQGYGVSRNGCPLKPPDSDGDGVPDKDDKCPGKGDLGYGLNANGCPVPAPDSDGDGVNDSVDKCPRQGDQGAGVDRGGCPIVISRPPAETPEVKEDEPPPEEKKDEPPPEEKKEEPPPEPEPTTAPT